MKYIYIIITCYLLVACGNNNIVVLETEEQEAASLFVADILKNNPNVKVGPVLSQNIEKKLPCTGILAVPPTALISIHSKSEGYIESMKYLVGDYVKKGALLYTISNPKLIEKQRILLEVKAELDLAYKEFARKKELQQKEAISQKDFDEAYGQKKLLEAKYNGLKSELKLVGINLESLESAHKFQEKIFIYAPESAYVTEVLVNKGQMINPENKLMGMANKDNIQLELKVLTKDIAFLKKGQQVLFTLDNQTAPLQASITQLSPAVNSNGVLIVYCNIAPNQALFFNAGMFVNAEIVLGSQVVKGIPLDAVIQEGEQYFAFFVKDKYFVKERLENAQVINDFVVFTNLPKGNMLLQGAYYIEA